MFSVDLALRTDGPLNAAFEYGALRTECVLFVDFVSQHEKTSEKNRAPRIVEAE